MTKTFNVICIKWGTYYGAEDVNKLCAAIKRNTSYDVNFYCFTERTEPHDRSPSRFYTAQFSVTSRELQ